jgi:predicted amino acid-binding ACT domain protein
MNSFQIITLIFSGLFLFSSIISVYVACKVALAKIEVEIVNIKKDLMQKEFALCLLEKNNREDHKELVTKIDKLIERIIK